MSDNNVTMEMVEAELFKILNGMSPLGAGGGGLARVEAARILLKSLEKRKETV